MVRTPSRRKSRRASHLASTTPAEQNTIFIGAKPPMNYVLAVVTQFNGGANEVLLKARGRAISRAVDVAEIVRNRFVEEADVKDVRIGTERVVGDKGRASNVSAIEIVLAKGESKPPKEPAVTAAEPPLAKPTEREPEARMRSPAA